MDVRFEGFEVKIRVGDGAAARGVAERVVREHLGAGWELVPSILDPRLFEIRPRGVTMTVPESWDRAREIGADAGVEWAEPVLQTEGLVTERLPVAAPVTRGTRGGGTSVPQGLVANWHCETLHCGIRDAWNITKGEGIRIAHPDTGYMKHAEIFADGRVLALEGFDFVAERNDPLVLAGGSTHGTATASVIISAVDPADNKTHVLGVAPRAHLIPMRVDDDVIHWRWSRARRAVEHAIAKNCHVISMSFGGPIAGPSLHEAIQTAIANGLILVAAAGNHVPFVVYPARYNEVICVAATTHAKAKWSGSARGSDVDVAAPGEHVWRATMNGNVEEVAPSSGTSYATAIVAGVAALWLARHGRDALIRKYGKANLSAVFRDVVMKHGVDVPAGWDRKNMGAGIINATKVLNAPLPATAPARGGAVTRGAVAAAPPPQTHFDDIAHYFPDTPPSVVRANLVKMLNTTDAQLDAELARFGDELKLHAALNEEIRARLTAPVPAAGTMRGAATAAPAPPVVASRPMLSGGLRGQMGV
ncbi:MAG TPA: S8 family serine peptidase [Thermoanaerobaculia bacterium]|nr:S8 family serine peptidase [Thermoanaerobaculia bacterium]